MPPTDRPAAERSANPARIMLNSPLAASMRARVFHQRTRQRPRERGLRTLAAVGALVLHLLFLFGFVLGPAYQPKPPHESKVQLLQVRLIEPPEPPPPPPVRGTPPKERGPRHQGRRRIAPSTEPSANVQATQATRATLKAAKPVVAAAAKASAKVARPVAAPAPPVAVPKPAPVPDLKPVPLASEPPTVELPTPVLQPPAPPKFQPESVRRPQLEGNQALPPPPSLAMPEVPPQAAPPVAVPSIALNIELPKSSKPASVVVAPAELSGAPPAPALQPVPLPAQPPPNINLQSDVAAPTPTVPQQRPQIQAPALEVAEAELEAVPVTLAESANLQPQAPAVKLDIADTAPRQSIAPAQLSAPAAQTATPAPQPATAIAPAKSASARTAEQPSEAQSTPAPGDVTTGRDVSRAPDATPQGSDSARVGEPEGAVTGSPNASTRSSAKQHATGETGNKRNQGDKGKQPGTGQPGGNQPGADQGEKQGALGGYVQLKPHGDTDIMQHGTPNIGYKATRFEQDWAPEGESSIDTALRHAVEKTTVSHTFHLPRG
ncbi:MAG: hypothetical protein M3Y93_03600, partial [Pseudomonadota bacterium]|nr:hypothetical protein [Pseudomonadota bacterium]